MNPVYGVRGEDPRYGELVRLLELDGNTVYDRHNPIEALSADVVVLPVPLTLDGEHMNLPGQPEMGEILSRLHPGQLILAGSVPRNWQETAQKQGLRLIDFLSREPVAVANAAATADAAVALAVERSGESLNGKRCLVLGFGRIGKLLCHRLRGLGAQVTAAARREEDRAWMRAYGYDALSIGRLHGALDGFAMVFNTVPAPVLDHALLGELPKECLLMELASRQGFAPLAAEKRHLPVVKASGLPGRMVPRTAAQILRNAVEDILREERGEPA